MPSLHAIFSVLHNFCSALRCCWPNCSTAQQSTAERTGKATARNRYGLAQQKRFSQGYSHSVGQWAGTGCSGLSRTLAATSANANTIVATVSGRSPCPSHSSFCVCSSRIGHDSGSGSDCDCNSDCDSDSGISMNCVDGVIHL